MRYEPRSNATEGAGLAPAPSRGGRRLTGRVGRALLVVAIAVGLFAVGSLAFRPNSGPAAVPTGPAIDTKTLGSAPTLPSDALARSVASLQAKLRVDPKDAESWAGLGFAYVQEARVTADPTFYPKAEGALRRSLALKPDGNFEAQAGLGSLDAARHRFADSLAWARKAEAIDPYNATIKAIVGDALLELGRYQEAFDEYQRMIDTRPDVSTYARVSYAQELQGSIPNAIKGMELAYGAAGTPADQAWASYYLGELYWNSGRPDRAAFYYRRGSALDPNFVPNLEGLAKVEAANGNVPGAIRDYTEVVARYPLPQYVIELGDLYTIAGESDRASQEYELVRTEDRLFQVNGVNIDLDIALFDADHRVDLASGLAAARAEWDRRKSVAVADALGWALYATGNYAEALTYAKRSLALGTRSALYHFHEGMIEKALGHTDAARNDLSTALDINPNFSFLWAETAKATLASLGGGQG